MITAQHAALSFWARWNKMTGMGMYSEQVYTMYNREIPWVLLPDAIRNVINERQAGHFEKHTDGVSAASWMEFPDVHTLKGITPKTAEKASNVSELVKFFVGKGIKKCVIGEYTDFETFNAHNMAHQHYHSLATHLAQDDKLDYFLREKLIDATGRFDDEFIIRHSGKKIDGNQLRAQVALFEEFGFIKLAGMIYQATGQILNLAWYEDNVHKPLLKVYPEFLAESAWGYMYKLLTKYDERISKRIFTITDEEKKQVILSDDLDKDLQELYVWSYWATYEQL